jgi:hypothetical protein
MNLTAAQIFGEQILTSKIRVLHCTRVKEGKSKPKKKSKGKIKKEKW